MRFKVLDIFKMNVKNIVWVFTLFILSVNAQEYKIKYATDLSTQFRYTEALPVWEELSTKALKTKPVNSEILRQTVNAAFLSENYKKASYWSKMLVTKGLSTPQDWEKYMNALLYLNQSSRLAGVLDSALMQHPSDEILLNKKQNLKALLENVKQTAPYSIRIYKKTGEGEDFGAFPLKEKGILFVTNEYNHNAINKTYPRTGQFYTDIAYFDSSKVNQKYKVYQKPFWTNFFHKNLWREVKRTNGHDGPVSFNEDYSMMFLTSNFEQKDIEGKMKYSRLRQRVFVVENGNYREIDFPFNSIQYSTGHATMDAQGNVYFSSNRPGSSIHSISVDPVKYVSDTVVSSDIWMTSYKDGEWSEPVRLGDDVNTTENELFPFISKTGILYFSSFGWNSIGGMDVFMSELDGQKPIHIGTPLNSSADDFAYYVDEETGKGYFSTNRVNFVDRIYAFNKPVYQADLVVELKNCKGTAIKSKEIVITDLKSGKVTELTTDKNGKTEPFELMEKHAYKIVYAGDKTNSADSVNFTANQQGSQTAQLKTFFKQHVSKVSVKDANGVNLSDVRLNVYKHNGTLSKMNTDASGSYAWKNEGSEKVDSIVANFINHDDARVVIPESVSGNCVDTVNYSIVLREKQESEFIRLDLVLYNFDKYFLRPEGKLELDKLVKYMKEHPDLKVELSSHTDSRGSDKYNMKLSKNRAKSCVDYIISQGIAKKLITAQGYGETKLRNNCSNGVKCTKEEHQDNRRTELKLITPENNELNNNKLE